MLESACEDELLAKPIPAPKIRVLVADRPPIAKTMVMILNMSGFTAFAAYTVNDAVRIAGERVVDVVLVELLLEETGALDVAAGILAIWPRCRVVIWTGMGKAVVSELRDEIEKRCWRCELLLKPAHPDRIIRVLRGEPVSWDEIFRQLDEDPFPPEFMADRDQGVR